MVKAAAASPVAPAPSALRRSRFTSGERCGTFAFTLKVIAFSGQTSSHLRQVMHSEMGRLDKIFGNGTHGASTNTSARSSCISLKPPFEKEA